MNSSLVFFFPSVFSQFSNSSTRTIFSDLDTKGRDTVKSIAQDLPIIRPPWRDYDQSDPTHYVPNHCAQCVISISHDQLVSRFYLDGICISVGGV